MKRSLPSLQTTLLASLSLSSSQALHYVPNGGVVGDFDRYEDMPPKVVLNYLSSCAGVQLNVESCEMDTYIRREFPGPAFGGLCRAPVTKIQSVLKDITAATAECQGIVQTDGGNVAVNPILVTNVTAALANERCWDTLCEERDIHLQVESVWMKTCTDMELPYPQPHSDHYTFTQPEGPAKEDALLTCMLDYVMDTPASEFGLDNAASLPFEHCYPPGYEDVANLCPAYIGQKALDKCKDTVEDHHYVWFDDWYGGDFSMSMSMNYSPTLRPTPSPTSPPTNAVDYVGKLCTILEDLSSDRGQHCLSSICDIPPTPTPSKSPSLEPSFTTVPSATPSLQPSTVPSKAPSSEPSFTTQPSASPSAEPSFTAIPSASPSVEPSAEPSFTAVPSASPSSEPSFTAVPSASPSAEPSFTAVPSASPSAEPSFTMVPSAEPSAEPSFTALPSASPSATPSLAPTSVPSQIPSVAPSSAPSRSPSEAPSISVVPTLSEVEAIVTVEMVSTVTLLDISISDVPPPGEEFDRFQQVVETAIEETVSDESDTVDATLLSINGIPVPQRRLRRLDQEVAGVEVGFMLVAVDECVVANCTAIPVKIMAGITKALEMEGQLTAKLQQAATTNNVVVLQTARVEPGSFEVTSVTSSIDETEDETPPTLPPVEPIASSSSSRTIYCTVLTGFLMTIPLFAL